MSKASHSEIDSFLMCERRHFYNYGLEIERQYTSEAQLRGNVGHMGLYVAFSLIKMGENELGVLLDAARQAMQIEARKYTLVKEWEYHKIVFEAMQLILWYLEHNLDFILTWEILALEKRYDVEIPGADGYVIPFIVDLIANVPGHGVLIIDHKFTYDFTSSDKGDILPQLAKYFGAMKIKGAPVDGAAYNELRYRDTKENKEDPSQRFRFTPLELSRSRVITTMKEQIKVAGRIAALKELPLEEWEEQVVRSSNNTNCKFCPFSDICEVDLNGRSRVEILKNEYKIRERRADDETIQRIIETTSDARSMGGDAVPEVGKRL